MPSVFCANEGAAAGTGRLTVMTAVPRTTNAITKLPLINTITELDNLPNDLMARNARATSCVNMESLRVEMKRWTHNIGPKAPVPNMLSL